MEHALLVLFRWPTHRAETREERLGGMLEAGDLVAVHFGSSNGHGHRIDVESDAGASDHGSFNE